MKIFDCADLNNKHFWYYMKKGITPDSEGIAPILETDKEINLHDLFIINDIAYTVCCMDSKKEKSQCAYAYVKKLKEQNVFISNTEPKEREYTNEITCPYCGGEIESFEMYDENEEYKCEHCKSVFSYQRIVTIEYSSQPVRKAIPVILN